MDPHQNGPGHPPRWVQTGIRSRLSCSYCIQIGQLIVLRRLRTKITSFGVRIQSSVTAESKEYCASYVKVQYELLQSSYVVNYESTVLNCISGSGQLLRPYSTAATWRQDLKSHKALVLSTVTPPIHALSNGTEPCPLPPAAPLSTNVYPSHIRF